MVRRDERQKKTVNVRMFMLQMKKAMTRWIGRKISPILTRESVLELASPEMVVLFIPTARSVILLMGTVW